MTEQMEIELFFFDLYLYTKHMGGQRRRRRHIHTHTATQRWNELVVMVDRLVGIAFHLSESIATDEWTDDISLWTEF